MGLNRLPIVLTVAVVLPVASADTILTRRAESIRSVKIIGFNQARLEAVFADTGRRQAFEFDRIAVIRVDGKAALNRAEKLVRLKQPNQAIDAYQVALTKASATWEKTWINVRLFRLLARKGQLERAAAIYIDLARQIGDWAVHIVPAAEDLVGDSGRKRAAAAKLLEARNVSTSGKTREALNRLLERLGYGQPPSGTHLPVHEITEQERIRFSRPGPSLDGWAERQLQAGRTDVIAQKTDRLYDTAVRADLPAILYWQGRVLLAKRQHDAAALKCLRVAIEFPKSRYAPYALFYAAEALTKGTRQDYATNVRRELIAKHDNSPDLIIAQRVDEAKEKVKSQNAKRKTEE